MATRELGLWFPHAMIALRHRSEGRAMIALIWFSFVIGPMTMAYLYHKIGRQHKRLWLRLAGVGLSVLAINIFLSLIHISIGNRTVASLDFLIWYGALLASLLVLSSSSRGWVSTIAIFSFFTIGLTLFMVALPGYPLFDFVTSDLIGPAYFYRVMADGSICEATSRGSMDDYTRIRLYKRVEYAAFLQFELGSKLEASVTANPELSCRQMMDAHATQQSGGFADTSRQGT